MAVRFPSKKILSCIWVAIPVDWVILHWYACGVEGWVGGWTDVQSHDYKSLWKFLRCIDNQIFLPMVLCCTHKSSAIIIVLWLWIRNFCWIKWHIWKPTSTLTTRLVQCINSMFVKSYFNRNKMFFVKEKKIAY